MQKEDKVCNITPANRVGSVQEYYFSKKLKEVAEMNAAGKNVINLGVGSPDLPPSEHRHVCHPAGHSPESLSCRFHFRS
jgi:LL-diaminopimelate aminotransferase